MRSQIDIITEYDKFLGLKNTWNNLLENSGNDIVFLRHEWFKCWWEAFGGNNQLFIVTVKNHNKIIAIAPLMISYTKYRGLRFRELGLIQNDNSPRADLIVTENKEEVIDILFRYFKKQNKRWDIVSLKNISEDSPTCSMISGILKQGNFTSGIKKTRSSPYLKIESDWPSYISQKSAKFRRTLRNKLNRVKKLKNFKIEKIKNINSENSNVISHIIEVSRNSWKGKCLGDLARTSENEKFFKNLSIEASKNNWLNIWLLSEEADKPVAYQYHLKYKNKTYAMRSDYDENYKYYSPGCVLEKFIVEESINEKLSEYDLCGNYYDYKMSWANEIRDHVTYELFMSKFRSRLLYQFEYKALPLARKLGLNKIKQISR